MATDKDIKEAIGMALGEAFQQVAQSFQNQHGIVVEKVEITWADVTTQGHGRRHYRITDIDIQSKNAELLS